MLNFLARFFPNLSDVIKALGELTYKDVSFQWTDSHDKAFVESKKLIAQGPVCFCVISILSCLQPFKWMCLVLALVNGSCKMICLC